MSVTSVVRSVIWPAVTGPSEPVGLAVTVSVTVSVVAVADGSDVVDAVAVVVGDGDVVAAQEAAGA
jgi:hypothetical protein